MSAVILDISNLSCDRIKKLLLEGQDMPGKPLMFKVKTAEQAESALRHYHGIAAIFAPDGVNIKDTAKKYGAYIYIKVKKPVFLKRVCVSFFLLPLTKLKPK